ncbi:DNA gyrase inhibitor YacG [Candidatus Phycosocius spiralis]|uniref:DNA gyrase inhibitor YacG n=1 Tax=Candidatus Phycosocius spiralis TaxID=2815099 RepID=UPI0024E064FA|nr:DNA gyrase inhibitor YacG [Candidatus Phycosocius spiralis]
MSRTCPECSKPSEHAYRPFCSKRCADLDLGRWLNASYAIPVHEEDNGINDAGEPIDTGNLIR